jgi:hypothetical protein
MRKWSGDGRFFLPARRIEPYRLWFEFLKAADRDPDISVDEDFYAEWGDYKTLTFNQWWTSERFRSLFAVDAGVRVLNADEAVVSSRSAITVTLPLSRDPQETIKDVKELLQQHGASIVLRDAPQGKFAFTEGYEAGFIKYLKEAQYMLRIYQAWLDNAHLPEKERLLKTAEVVVAWTKKRVSYLKSKNAPRENYPYINSALDVYVANVQGGRAGGYNRMVLLRYLKKARQRAQNAAVGIFPGELS